MERLLEHKGWLGACKSYLPVEFFKPFHARYKYGYLSMSHSSFVTRVFLAVIKLWERVNYTSTWLDIIYLHNNLLFHDSLRGLGCEHA